MVFKNAVISLAPLPIQGFEKHTRTLQALEEAICEGLHQCIGGNVSAMPVNDLWMFSFPLFHLLFILCICSKGLHFRGTTLSRLHYFIRLIKY